MSDERELVYVGDPMCSWCWGMSPALAHASHRYGIPLRVVVGGLRPGPAADVMDDSTKQAIAHHWHQVQERTGQPFDFTFFERQGFVYDTEPSCVAVVAARELDPDLTLPMFERVQRAFYAENTDVTDPEALTSLAGEIGLDEGLFRSKLDDDATRQLAWEDFRHARQLGVTGFPTLLLREGRYHWPVSLGYSPVDRLDQVMTTLVPDTAVDAACDVDGGGSC